MIIIFVCTFDSDVASSFAVKIAGSDIDYEGHIEIPNLSDENEADEVDVYCHIFFYSLFYYLYLFLVSFIS